MSKTIEIISQKNGDNIERHNVATDPSISIAEINAAGGTMQVLCFNLAAGTVAEEIREAASKKRLPSTFPAMSNADLSALRNLLTVKPSVIVKSWNAYAASVKRVRNVSLQALNKAVKGKPATEKKASVADQFKAAWLKVPAKTRNTKGLVPLFDLAVELGYDPEKNEFDTDPSN